MKKDFQRLGDAALPLESVFESRPPVETERDAVFAVRDALSRALPEEFEIRLGREVLGEQSWPDLLINERTDRKRLAGHSLAVEIKANLARPMLPWRRRPSAHPIGELRIGSTAIPVKYYTISDITADLDGVVADIRHTLDVEGRT